MPPYDKLKIMVASTVYGFEDPVRQICSVLDQYGYAVLNSQYGTIRNNPTGNNLEDCLRAVEECDVFLGIIRPYYGSGVIGTTSIVHEEMKKVLQSDKPRWIMVDDRLEFLRQILRKNAFQLPFAKTPVLDDLRVIELYDDMMQTKVPVAQRHGYWVQPYHSLDDILRYIDTNLKDVEAVRKLL
jgi:hypothetical protein